MKIEFEILEHYNMHIWTLISRCYIVDIINACFHASVTRNHTHAFILYIYSQQQQQQRKTWRVLEKKKKKKKYRERASAWCVDIHSRKPRYASESICRKQRTKHGENFYLNIRESYLIAIPTVK